MNGTVGMKVTVALCDLFKIRSNRNTVSQTIIFDDGIPSVLPVEELEESEHGLDVTFKPSEKYLGEFFIKCEMIEDYLRKMSYLIPDDLAFEFHATMLDGNERDIEYTSQTLDSNVKFLSSSIEFPTTDIIIETDNFDIEICFSYDKAVDDILIDSYCNYVVTTEGGTHITACIKALCEFFVREAKNLDPNSKYEVTFDDCRKGLVIAIAGWHYDPAFEGQHKSKVTNEDFLKEGKDCLKQALSDYFQRNNGLLRKIVAFLRKNVQVRLEAAKIKGTKIQKSKNTLDYMDIPGFRDITDPNDNAAAEILFTEGRSAAGAIDNIRNRKYQAVYEVRGVATNPYGMSLQKVMTVPLYRNMVRVLGCGIGPSFNIQNLRFRKIIILTDTDVDGSHITSLMLVFICHFLPELVTNGYVYKALSPLYQIDMNRIKKFYKGNNWLYSKKELYDISNNIIADNISIGIKCEDDTFVELSKKDKKHFLEVNSEYLMELNMLKSRAQGHPIVLEYATYYRYLYGNDVDKFKEAIEAKFPEVNYNITEQLVSGSYNREPVTLFVDTLFDKMSERVKSLMAMNDFFEFYYKNKNDKNSVYELTTIGQFFKEMDSMYKVDVRERFKGLGEADSELLFKTTINPKFRILIRYTIADMKDALASLKLYHGTSNDDREARRGILAESRISFADIDN